jgi:regulator of protease activity HflC (stomatin/prohibitin superfamily)
MSSVALKEADMQQRRKAAADVFQEQHGAQLAEEAPSQASFDAAMYSPAAAPAPGSPLPPPRRRAASAPAPVSLLKTSEQLQLEKEPIPIRVTGFWIFKQIIVPPNVYVVHTRIGRPEPVTIGMGLSFRYNPVTDAYLVVPAAMQTIGIVANSISREKQGINVLAYVQWQINDFSVAYRKLDFSDVRDPLGIVNAQLREQAEAAIKDKIATLSVEEVLTDKEPIIAELTARLKAVAEGRGQEADEGLGIKIVTVQIKEALVSSQRLWEDLQAPFRYEQEKTARISYLLAQDEIRVKELQNRKLAETSEAETMVEIARTTQTKQTEAQEIRLAQEGLRFTSEQQTTRQQLQLELETALARQEAERRRSAEAARIAQEATLDALRRAQAEAITRAQLDAEAGAQRKAMDVARALQEMAEETRLATSQLEAEQQRIAREVTFKRLEAELRQAVQAQEDALRQQQQLANLEHARQGTLAQLELQEATDRVRLATAAGEAEIERVRQDVRNLIGERDLASRLVERLPELAAHMPEIHELKVLQSSGDGAFDALPLFLAKLVSVAESLGIDLRRAS